MRRVMALWLRFSIWRAKFSIALMQSGAVRNVKAISHLRAKRDQAAVELLNLEMDRP